MLSTNRLLLRPWTQADAQDLYRYAKDPAVGPITGWPPHQSVEESRRVIEQVLSHAEDYAICLKEDGKAIGAISLMAEERNRLSEREKECELGFWLGKPFWGQGIMPEAAQEILRHAFEELGMQAVWCGYYDGNRKSARVQQKLGFTYLYTNVNVYVPLMQEKRAEHIGCLTRQEWLKHKQKEEKDGKSDSSKRQ